MVMCVSVCGGSGRKVSTDNSDILVTFRMLTDFFYKEL